MTFRLVKKGEKELRRLCRRNSFSPSPFPVSAVIPNEVRNLLLNRNGLAVRHYHSARFGRFLISLRSIRNDISSCEKRRKRITAAMPP